MREFGRLKKSDREAWAAIENAYRAAKSMGNNGVLMICFLDGSPTDVIFNPGKKRVNEIEIMQMLTAIGLS